MKSVYGGGCSYEQRGLASQRNRVDNAGERATPAERSCHFFLNQNLCPYLSLSAREPDNTMAVADGLPTLFWSPEISRIPFPDSQFALPLPAVSSIRPSKKQRHQFKDQTTHAAPVVWAGKPRSRG